MCDDEYHTLDDWSSEPQLDAADDDGDKDDIWGDEETLQFSNVPKGLWSDSPINVVPGQPELWVDRLADEVEILKVRSVELSQQGSSTIGD